jgi:hypothetical protein
LTSAFIAGLSDVIAQRLISGGYKNWRRTLALAIYGFLWNGPSAHFWQSFMENLFRGSSGLQTVLKKVGMQHQMACLLPGFVGKACAKPWEHRQSGQELADR